MRIKVPGNILLLGEYAVTLPGGLGVCFAIDRFVTIEIEKAPSLSLSTTQDDRLIRLILEKLSFDQAVSIHVDSSDFYDATGRKKGFGSSAAVTVGLVYGLLKFQHEKEPDLEKEVLPLALDIHRTFQGGKGSGYDIMTSLFGGIGLFQGGVAPSWTPLTPKWDTNMYLLSGAEEVSTKNALTLFDKLEKKSKFFRVSNQVVKRFVQTQSLKLLERARLLHRWIHQQFGVYSECKELQNYKGPKKSVGAGGEIAVVFGEKTCPLLEKIAISKQGVQCL